MAEPLLYSFTRFDDAASAQAALTRAGVAPDAIQLRVLTDEAGPTEGNFYVGNGRTQHGGPPGPVLTGGEVPYESNFADAVWHGSHLLTVVPADDAQRRMALETLARHGGTDVNAAAGSAHTG